MLADLRYSARLFRRSPGFALTVVLTLALGIGLTTAMFSVVYASLLRRLPYSNPSALVTARSVRSETLLEWRDKTAALADIGAYDFGQAPLILAADETVRLRQAAITSNLLSLLGVRPVLGRDFHSTDSMSGAEPVAMLTYRAWQQHFGGRPDIVGTVASFEPTRRRIVGVLPPDFLFPMRFVAAAGEVRVLTPIPVPLRAGYTFGVIARLKTDATLALARAEELAMARRAAPADRVAAGSSVVPLADALLGGSRRSLLMLFGAVSLLLLIACANVGNLLFAKGAEGRQELAVRLALGASRRRVIRLMLVQSCTLSVVGGLLGALLAFAAIDVLRSMLPPQLPRASDIAVDHRALGFAFALSLITGATLGLFPAWRLSRGELQPLLQAQNRTTLPAQRLRLVVLATEVALAVVLLSGAALFAHSLARLLAVDLGFAPQNVVTLQVRTLQSRYPTIEQQRTFLAEVLDRIAVLPGVANAAAVELLPVTRARRGGSVFAEDGPTPPVEAEPRVVSSGYFDTMGIGVALGRALERRDASGAPQVAVINETLARRLWPGANPIGRRLRYENEEPREVVGVVRDVRGFAVDTSPEPQVYVPYLQTSLVPQRVVIRSSATFEPIAAAVRRELRAIDSRAAAEGLEPLTAHVAASIAQPRFLTWLLAVFAGSGLLLAAVGIAGVVAYAVSRRTREIGIRVALGASARDIVGTVMRPSLAAVATGASAGVAATLGLGRFARAFLFEIGPQDPAALSGAVLVLGAVALVAAWLPARRAHRVDPVVALRAE